MAENLPESETSSNDDFMKDTELTLGLPCRERAACSGTKRGFSYSDLDLNLVDGGNKGVNRSGLVLEEDEEASSVTKPPLAKAQLVGWPPVRQSRKNIATSMAREGCKYVKVAVDGAPFLRKVDLQVYNSYEQLLNALGHMFSCYTICNYFNDGKLVMERVKGTEYAATYEDKDGDWMMVGDVPWKMFVESCKRLRLMKSSEAIGLAPRTPAK